MRRKKQIIRVNQLSESKIDSYVFVNKRINALFNVFGIYCIVRIFCKLVSYSSDYNCIARYFPQTLNQVLILWYMLQVFYTLQY